MRLTGRKLAWPGIVAASLALAWFYGLNPGQDVNWDQLNYHLSTPFLLLDGHFWDSVAPSGIQSYYNPMILFPQYLLIATLPPMLATWLLASLQAVAFILAGWICVGLARSNPDAGWLTAGGFALCLCSPIALSEAGTTYVDLITAVPVLAAFGLLLRRETGAAPWRHCLAAGALLGLAAGLKLTNMIYLFGLPGMFLTGQAPRRHRAGLLLATAAASVVGLLACSGYWHLLVWQRFGNPLFPYYNNVFGSPDFPATALTDARFTAKSAWDVVRYPLYWLLGGSPSPDLKSPSAEVDPHDARFAMVLVGLAAVALIRRLRVRFWADPASGLLIAWACVYVVWLKAFGIHRYMVGLEILTGAVLLVLLLRIPGRRWRLCKLAAVCAISVIVLHVPRWQRMPFTAVWSSLQPGIISLPGRPLIFLADYPTTFAAASLPSTASYVGLNREIDVSARNDTSLTRQLRAMLADPGRTPYVLSDASNSNPIGRELQSWHLGLGAPCQEFRMARDTFSLCPLHPVPH
jgi:hypothetical protein